MTAVDLRASVDALSESGAPSFLAIYRDSGTRDAPTLELLSGQGEGAASLATDGSCTVLFAGRLFERERLGPPPDRGREGSDAEAVLAAYRRSGEDFLSRIRGAFALAVHDAGKGTLLFARDQLGHHPLFFAEGRDGLYLSETITTLVRSSGVSAAPNRAAVAETLLHRPKSPDETPFEAVSRARAGWSYRVTRSGTSASRYWFPVAPDGSADWVTKAELGEFDALMEQAVSRSLEPGATGIFLSGGLDSVTVAMFAADVLERAGASPPHALSLAFPEFDETSVQTAVAGSLGLPHELVPFAQAAGTESLVMSAVRASGSWPAPLVNLWQPLYTHLALRGRANGVRTILTGAGGDEWLQVSPEWGFSNLRRLRVRQMHHLYRTYLHSYNLERLPLLKNLLWKYGLYYTLRGAAIKTAKVLAPGYASELKRRKARERRPAWLAPDPALAQALDERAGELDRIGNPSVRYVGESRPFLEHPIGAMEREEAFERGRRLGMQTFMPFWDVDLVEFVARVPPDLLNEGYWSKGLVRAKLARRFPEAGFEHQRKILSTSLSTKILADESPDAWREIGGASALGLTGIVDEKRLESNIGEKLRIMRSTETAKGQQVLERAIAGHEIWTVLNVESWLRQWT